MIAFSMQKHMIQIKLSRNSKESSFTSLIRVSASSFKSCCGFSAIDNVRIQNLDPFLQTATSSTIFDIEHSYLPCKTSINCTIFYFKNRHYFSSKNRPTNIWPTCFVVLMARYSNTRTIAASCQNEVDLACIEQIIINELDELSQIND